MRSTHIRPNPFRALVWSARIKLARLQLWAAQ